MKLYPHELAKTCPNCRATEPDVERELCHELHPGLTRMEIVPTPLVPHYHLACRRCEFDWGALASDE